MVRTVSAETRHDLLQAVREQYRAGTKEEKRRILDEMAAVTGYHRKHVIRLLTTKLTTTSVPRGGTRRLAVYDEAVREALVVLWEASDRVCGKRLIPLLPILVSALEQDPFEGVWPTVRTWLEAEPDRIGRIFTPEATKPVGT